MFAVICTRNAWMFAHWAWRHMSDCSYAAMSNHKLTVANLCVKSNSMWTNFADNGKIHTCMYNVCTMYTTAVGVISPRQLARLFAPKWIRYLVQRLLDTGSWRYYGRTVRGKLLAGKCLRGNVLFASLTRHTLRLWALTRPSAQPTVPCHGKSGCLRLRSN